MKSILNFGLIGVGSFGIKRARSIIESANANLVAIYDNDKIKCKKIADELKTQVYDENEIFENSNIDVICICAPNSFHKDYIKKAIKSNKHIFCEKPLVRNLQEAEELINFSQNFNKKIQIGSNHRFFESVIFAKKLVDENTIGDVLSFNGRIGHNGERLKDSWFWKKAISGGGTLLDNGCHLLDLSRYFCGSFDSGIGSFSNSYWKDIEVEDTASAIFKSKGGVTATIFCSWRLLSGYFFFELNGSNGYINVDGRFDTHGGDKIYWSKKGDNKILSKDFSHIKPNSYKLEIENFVTTILSNGNCSPSLKDGFEIMKMISYVYNK